MVRPFPTRFPNSLISVVLLVPCLLICLACATPFPIESLQEGMTAGTVRDSFGEPRATEIPPYLVWAKSRGFRSEVLEAETGQSAVWTYVDEDFEPLGLTVGPMALRVGVTSILQVFLFPFMFADLLAYPWDDFTDDQWNRLWISRKLVLLRFEGEELVQWEVLPDLRDAVNDKNYPSRNFEFCERNPQARECPSNAAW